MRTKSLMALAMAAALTTFLAVAAPAQSSGTTSDGVALNSMTAQPDGDVRAENIDGSPVNAKVQTLAAKIARDFDAESKRPGVNRPQLVVDTIVKMDELYREDGKNLFVRAFLGYLLLENQDAKRAAEVLEPAQGRSAVPKVNRDMAMNLSLAYYLSADFEKAGMAYARLAEDPAAPGSVHRFAGSSFLLANKPAEAIKHLERAKTGASDAEKASILRDLGIAYIRVQDEANALRTFEELEKSSDAGAETLSWMGFQYVQAKRFADAIRVLEKAKSAGPFNPTVYNNLANAYAGTSERQKAIDLYSELAKRDASNPVPHYNIGTLYMMGEQYNEAIAAFSTGVRLSEGSDNPQLKFVLNNLGVCHEKLGKFEEAATAYARASDLDPGRAVFAQNAGMAYYRAMKMDLAVRYLERAAGAGASSESMNLILADVYGRAGRNADALRLLKAAVVTNDNSLNIWFNIGVLSYKTGDKAGAEAAYRKALGIKPDDTDTLNNLGLLLLEQNKVDEAITVFEKMTGAARGSVEGRISMAAALFRAGRLADAVEVWKGILATSPDRTDVRLSYADGLWNLGVTRDARAQYQQVLRSQPNNPRALNGLGLFQLLNADNKGAEDFFRRAMSADSKYLPPYNNLAIALERQNKRAEAILTLERALRIDPNFADAKANLARLRAAG